jgi:hypothetical protein
MRSFGDYAICDAVAHNFSKAPAWWWKIEPPTSGDELNMSRFLIQGRVVFNPEGDRTEMPPTNIEIAHREIALSFGGTNIPANIDQPTEKGGDALIVYGAPVESIEAVLKEMPHAMVMEIWSAIGEAVVGWGPYRPKALEVSET